MTKQNPGIETPHLIDYYYLLLKRRWLILSSLFLMVLLTALFTFSMKPVYRATARIIIEKETTHSPLTGERIEFESYVSQQLTFRTHFKMITSRPVLERVLVLVNPSEESEEFLEQGLLTRFKNSLKSNLKRLISSIFGASRKSEQTEALFSPEEKLLSGQIASLRGKITIEEVRDTRLLNIQVEDQDPRVARDIANTLAETYIQYESGTRLENSRKMLDWLSNQLYSMKKKVEDAERAFLAFKKRENIFSFEGKQKINVQKIEEVNVDYIQTQSQLLEAEAKIHELKKFIKKGEGTRIRNIPTFLNNEFLQQLYSELLRAEVEYRRISSVFKHKHPEMIKITSKIDELSSKIGQQLQKALDNENSQRAVLMAREKALKNAMGNYEAEAINTNRKELQYGILEREVATNRELYNTLLTKIKESDITARIIESNLRLVEPAAVPIASVKPKKTLNLILSVIFGLLTGVSLAFFLEYLDQTLHNKKDAEKFLGMPVLSEVPLVTSNFPKRKTGQKLSIPKISDLTLNDYFPEALRGLATNLRFTELNPSRGIYLITSSAPKEGKSTICFNLGLTLAHQGLKTLLVDADLRMPAMKQIAGIDNKQGLTDILVKTFNTDIRKGSLGELAVNDIHKILEVQEKTGVLHYQNETYQFEVLLKKGKIIDVDWPTRPAGTRLGTLLVQSGKITKQQAQIALAKQKSTSERLGQVLLHLGFLSVEELAGSLKLHIQENIRELHRCKRADFHFEENEELASILSEPKVSALEEAIGKIDTSSQKNTPFLIKAIHKHLFQIPKENLWVLPSGKIPSDPTKFLASKRMRVLLDLLRDEFDFIFLDSPPLGHFSDGAVLASNFCDGVILVIRAGKTRFAEIRRAREQLHAVQSPMVGAVLNMLDFKKDPYYYDQYYQKYDQYYRKTEKSKKKKRKGTQKKLEAAKT